LDCKTEEECTKILFTMTKDLNEIKKKFHQINDPFEKADFLKKTLQSGDISFEKLAKTLQISSSYIAHYLRLLKLPEIIIDGYYADSITISHLFVISRLKNQKDMIDLYEQVLAYNLSVQNTEEKVREILYGIQSHGYKRYLDPKRKEQIKKKVKKIFGEQVDIKIIQTRVRTKVILQLKGNLLESNKFLKEFEKLLISE